MTIAMTAANKGLRDVFLNFTIEIYNLVHVWQGDNNTSDWDGYANKVLLITKCPDGTYYYVDK
jgi:hypothetical protein